MMNRSRARRNYHRRNKVTVRTVWILSVLAAAVIIYGAVELLKGKDREVRGEQVIMESIDMDLPAARSTESRLMGEISVGGVALTGLTPGQARQKLEDVYLWDMKVTDGEESVTLNDPLKPQLEKILAEIDNKGQGAVQRYDLDYDQVEQSLEEQAADLAQKWDKGAVDSQMESFDKTAGVYHYTREVYGRNLRQDQLVADLMEAARRGEFTSKIQAEFDTISPKRTSAQARD